LKEKINKLIDWFEKKFNIIIDMLALVGGAFCIFLAIFAFISLLIPDSRMLNNINVIIVPGAIGFFGILILFALRITRHLTRK